MSISPIAENTSRKIFPIGSITGDKNLTASDTESIISLKRLSKPSPNPAKVPVKVAFKSEIASIEVRLALSVAFNAPPAFIKAVLNSSADIEPDFKTLTISTPFLAPKISQATDNASVSVFAFEIASIVSFKPVLASIPALENTLREYFKAVIAELVSMPFFAREERIAIESVADIPNCENTD